MTHTDFNGDKRGKQLHSRCETEMKRQTISITKGELNEDRETDNRIDRARRRDRL